MVLSNENEFDKKDSPSSENSTQFLTFVYRWFVYIFIIVLRLLFAYLLFFFAGLVFRSLLKKFGNFGSVVNEAFHVEWKCGVSGSSEDLFSEILQEEALEDIKNNFGFEIEKGNSSLISLNGLLFRDENKFFKPSNLIFDGPPGVGKSYSAEALAKLLSSNYAVIPAGGLQELYVGSGARKWTSIINQAKKMSLNKDKPVVIIVEEFDSLARKDGSFSSRDDTLLNNLLATVDSIENNECNILIIGTTNHIKLVPEAAKRAGRFQVVNFNYLNTKGEYYKLVNLVRKKIERKFNVNKEKKDSQNLCFSMADDFWNYLSDCLFEFHSTKKINYTFPDVYYAIAKSIRTNGSSFLQELNKDKVLLFKIKAGEVDYLNLERIINKFLIFDRSKVLSIVECINRSKKMRNPFFSNVRDCAYEDVYNDEQVKYDSAMNLFFTIQNTLSNFQSSRDNSRGFSPDLKEVS